MGSPVQNTMWAWVAFHDNISNSVDPDWLSSEELAHLDMAAKLMLHGTKALAAHNCALVQPRWKTRPKLHTMWHINDDAQRATGTRALSGLSRRKSAWAKLPLLPAQFMQQQSTQGLWSDGACNLLMS